MSKQQTYEQRLADMNERDVRVCACGHRCLTHGSHDAVAGFAGVGQGPCGWCDCQRFSVAVRSGKYNDLQRIVAS